jgi:hypothetical protein
MWSPSLKKLELHVPVELSRRFASIHTAGGIPVRVRDSSVAGEAAQFHTRRGQCQLVSLDMETAENC